MCGKTFEKKHLINNPNENLGNNNRKAVGMKVHVGVIIFLNLVNIR